MFFKCKREASQIAINPSSNDLLTLYEAPNSYNSPGCTSRLFLTPRMHPSEVLFQGTQKPVSIPVCDHYAGAEKLMRKSLALQQELGPIFDITFDCEDGASAGNEAQHAQLIASLIASKENHFSRIGARVHDVRSKFYEQDCCRAMNALDSPQEHAGMTKCWWPLRMCHCLLNLRRILLRFLLLRNFLRRSFVGEAGVSSGMPHVCSTVSPCKG